MILCAPYIPVSIGSAPLAVRVYLGVIFARFAGLLYCPSLLFLFFLYLSIDPSGCLFLWLGDEASSPWPCIHCKNRLEPKTMLGSSLVISVERLFIMRRI